MSQIGLNEHLEHLPKIILIYNRSKQFALNAPNISRVPISNPYSNVSYGFRMFVFPLINHLIRLGNSFYLDFSSATVIELTSDSNGT